MFPLRRELEFLTVTQINSMFQRANHIAEEVVKDQSSFTVTYSSHKDNHDLCNQRVGNKFSHQNPICARFVGMWELLIGHNVALT